MESSFVKGIFPLCYKNFSDPKIYDRFGVILPMFEGVRDIDKLSTNLFGFSSKQSRRIISSKVLRSEGGADLYLSFLIWTFSKIKINKDFLFKACDTYFPEEGSAIELDFNILREFQNSYQDKRLIQLFFQEENLEYWKDIQEMVIYLKNKSQNLVIPINPKPQTMEELHNRLDATCQKLSEENFELNQRADVLALEGKKIKDGLMIKVPNTHYELVEVGGALNFCLGNGVYSNKIRDNLCSIVVVYDKLKPLYAIEFGRYKIMQSKGVANSSIPKEILLDIQDLLIKKPDLPEDFIPLGENHGWIQGFKYDNKDFYLMVKNVKHYNNFNIYKYLDVTQEDYEKFLQESRKGAFFNKEIKTKYDCEIVKVGVVY